MKIRPNLGWIKSSNIKVGTNIWFKNVPLNKDYNINKLYTISYIHANKVDFNLIGCGGWFYTRRFKIDISDHPHLGSMMHDDYNYED